jgi:hypothetical protein
VKVIQGTQRIVQQDAEVYPAMTWEKAWVKVKKEARQGNLKSTTSWFQTLEKRACIL